MDHKKYQVYRLLFPNNKIYIGITKNDIKVRFKDHCRKDNKNSLVKKAVRKYGKNNIIISILENNLSRKEALQREIYYIEKFNSYTNCKNSNGYNLTRGGDGCNGRPMPIEQRLKLANSKNFLVFDKITGTTIGRWQFTSECAKDLKINKNVINSCLRGDKRSYDKYTFIYEENYHGQDMKYIRKCWNHEKKLHLGLRNKLSRSHGGREFLVFNSTTGELVGKWINQAECAKDLKINRKHITPCLKGRRKTSHGYVFKYKDEQ